MGTLWGAGLVVCMGFKNVYINVFAYFHSTFARVAQQ